MDPHNARGTTFPLDPSFKGNQGSPWTPFFNLSIVLNNNFIKLLLHNKGGVQGEPWFPLFRNVNKNIKIVHKYLLFAWNKMTY